MNQEGESNVRPQRGASDPPRGPTSPSAMPEDAPEKDVSVLRLANVLLRHRRLIVATVVAVAFLVVAVTIVLPRTYTSTTSFTPESGAAQVSQLSGLASQFGINIPTGQAGQSPQFYADLLRGRELLREVVVSKFEARSGGPEAGRFEGDLVAILGINEDDRRLAVSKTIDELRELIGVSMHPETGVVELSVTTRWPDLSRQVAARMIELVNRFNLERRQSQASDERAFIEEQLARAESALYSAEDSLERFLERNRRYENSPQLRFEYERLQRRVSLRQQVFLSLSESYEQSKINEVRNTPVVTVVEAPEAPARPDPRRLVLKGILGLLLGGIIGVFWAFGREILAASRERDPSDYAEFTRLKEETREELQGMWYRLRRKTAGK